MTKPDSGTIKIFNTIVSDNNAEILKRIGSLIENPYFYLNLTGEENLELHCEYMGFYKKERISDVLKTVDLENTKNKPVSNYSLGMKQRLGIARAIITKPEILILDEPINSLDPDGIRELRILFKKLNKEYGTTIIISSHLLSEMELLADTVDILKEGRILKEVSMNEINDTNVEYILIETNSPSKTSYILEEKLGIQEYKIINEREIRVFDLNVKPEKISKVIVKNNINLKSIFKKKNSLEEYFFNSLEEE